MKILALMTLSASLVQASHAAESKGYKTCDKTYVSPDDIDFIENKIKVETKGIKYRTSAIYSDEDGLYYKDFFYTPPKEDKVPFLINNYLVSDARGADFYDKSLTETSPIYSDDRQELLPEPVETQPTIQDLLVQEEQEPSVQNRPRKPQPQKPTRTRTVSQNNGIWPYCDKMH